MCGGGVLHGIAVCNKVGCRFKTWQRFQGRRYIALLKLVGKPIFDVVGGGITLSGVDAQMLMQTYEKYF